MALVGEPELSREAREVGLACGQALERRTGAQPHPVPGDAVACSGFEDTAEVVWGDGEIAGELRQRARRVCSERLARAVRDRRAATRRGRTAGLHAFRVDAFERSGCERNRALDQLIAIVSTPCGRE